MYKLPERRGGGNLGNARKKTFFLLGGVPLPGMIFLFCRYRLHRARAAKNVVVVGDVFSKIFW